MCVGVCAWFAYLGAFRNQTAFVTRRLAVTKQRKLTCVASPVRIAERSQEKNGVLSGRAWANNPRLLKPDLTPMQPMFYSQ